ncbi:hypothetical protein JCM18899A_00160 [Nocardioides sp. AN3]
MNGWAIVVPVKQWSTAKSRVTGLTEQERYELAIGLATDTVGAICSTPEVAACLVVGPPDNLRDLSPCVDSPLVHEVEEQPDARHDPLNTALGQGRDAALSEGFRQVAMIVADLPGLTSPGLSAFLRLVPPTRPALVCDQAGTGTTLLAGRRGERLRPAFGTHSAARHRSDGALDVTPRCDPSLRLDVDTWADLTAAGCFAGPALRRWLSRAAVGLADQPRGDSAPPSKKLPAL